MLVLRISVAATKFLATVDRKHAGQISLKIFDLLHEPEPHDSAELKGTELLHKRIDVGEYRVVYRVEGDQLVVPIIGRRNDDEVYKQVRRKGL